MLMIRTKRLRLVASTIALARAELADIQAFAALLDAEVPPEWPPESMAHALPWFLEQLEIDERAHLGWLAWYGVLMEANSAHGTLIAGAGFKGPPSQGIVEVGYSVLTEYQRQGFAVEMVGALIDWALVQPKVQRVIAEAFPDNVSSLGVLRRLGFVEIGPGTETGTQLFEYQHR